MKEFEKFLPNQKLLKKNFCGLDKNYECLVYKNCLKNSSLFIPSIKSLKGFPDVPKTWMSSTALSLAFYAFLIQLAKPKRILEIGTFIGRATKTFLSAADKKCKVWTIEKYQKAYSVAQQNLKKEIKNKRCRLIFGDALKKIHEIPLRNQKYDFIFIDGDKESYHKYLSVLKSKLRRGGIIIVDDVFFQGDSMNKKPGTLKGMGVKKCLSDSRKLKNFIRICLPLGNGILILQKK